MLASSVAALGSLAAGGVLSGCSKSSARSADVIVVGAGLSGLIAARAIVKGGARSSCWKRAITSAAGWSEFRSSRAGGSTLAASGSVPRRAPIAAVANQLSVKTFPWYHEGKTVLNFNAKQGFVKGEDAPWPGAPDLVTARDRAARGHVRAKFEALAATVPPEAPWTAPNAPALDAETLATWLEQETSNAFARFMVTSLAHIGGSGAFDPSEVSLLHFAWTQRVAPQAENPESKLFYGAAGQIPPLLAAQLSTRVRLNQPVRSIEQDSTGVIVTSDSASYRALHDRGDTDPIGGRDPLHATASSIASAADAALSDGRDHQGPRNLSRGVLARRRREWRRDRKPADNRVHR
jgi:monoamine oxidase